MEKAVRSAASRERSKDTCRTAVKVEWRARVVRGTHRTLSLTAIFDCLLFCPTAAVPLGDFLNAAFSGRGAMMRSGYIWWGQKVAWDTESSSSSSSSTMFTSTPVLPSPLSALLVVYMDRMPTHCFYVKCFGWTQGQMCTQTRFLIYWKKDRLWGACFVFWGCIISFMRHRSHVLLRQLWTPANTVSGKCYFQLSPGGSALEEIQRLPQVKSWKDVSVCVCVCLWGCVWECVCVPSLSRTVCMLHLECKSAARGECIFHR